ncbi:MAG: hydrogenase maturation protease [bacterium]|nr:hydrogenase maturation protease [bacterium]
MTDVTNNASSSSPGILVIGMGNVLMQDEGVGVRAVEELECRYHIPPGIEIMDGGTTGSELFDPMRGRKHLIIADAINAPSSFGTLIRLKDDQVPAFFQTKISNHQLGVSDLLGLLQLNGAQPEHVTIIGMVPHSLQNRLGLSPKAEAGLEEMVIMLVKELEDIGFELKKRDKPLKAYWANQAMLEEDGECA